MPNGQYSVSVEDGVKQKVTGSPELLRLRLSLGEYAKRKADGSPVTILKQKDSTTNTGEGDRFVVDLHEDGSVRRTELTRLEIGPITEEELHYLGIINANAPVRQHNLFVCSLS